MSNGSTNVVPLPSAGEIATLTGAVGARRFDPRELGCRCDECALGALHRKRGTFKPVPPEKHGGEQVALVAEAPGNEEVIRGRPLVGASGRLTTMTLVGQGVSRSRVVLDNAMLCQPPLNDLKRFLHQAKKDNDRREARGEKLLLDPITACRPHLYRQAQETPSLLLLGKTPYLGLTGDNKAIRRIRGALAERHLYRPDGVNLAMWRHKEGLEQVLPPDALHLKIVPTLHPAFILRSRAWEPAFVKDFQRFFRWVSGTLQWRPPKWKACPTPAELEAFLFNPSFAFHSCDIETDGKDPYSARIRCIQISNPDGDGCVIPVTSLDGTRTFDGSGPWVTVWDENEGRKLPKPPTPFYNPRDAEEIRRILRAWHLDPGRIIVGHNYGYFDTAALWRFLGIAATSPCPGLFDTILAFRACHSELKRDLYTLGTMYTDVPDWKAADDDRKVAVDPRSDQELWEYGITDTCVDSRCATPLFQQAQARNQMAVLELDHKVQHIGRQMHRIGLYVDEHARAEKERELTEKKRAHRARIKDLVGSSTFNPASTQQLGRLFYGEWGLPILHMTDVGDPSTDDTTLFKLIHHKVLDDRQREVVDVLRALRKVEKELGTYVVKLRRWNDYRKNSQGKLVGGLVGPDGRVHPHYNVHTPATGRISSSGPNAQNFPKHLRKLIIPAPGMIFVGADYDQIELRLICAIAGVTSYLDVFASEGDPHGMTALLVYGKLFENELRKSYNDEEWAYYQRTGVTLKPKGKTTDLYESLRRFAKTFVYAVLYGGTAKTVYENVSTAEDDDGNLLFEGMELAEVRAAYDAWMRNAHQIPAWWDATWDFARRNGFVVEPILGRRRDFPTFERNEILNMPIQGGAGVIMGQGLVRLVNAIPYNAWGEDTGVVNQCHDAVTVQVPRERGKEACEILEESLSARYDHLPGVVFSVEAQTAETWKEAA